MPKFENLSRKVKSLFAANLHDMNRFYTYSTGKRQKVLDRVHEMNSSEEIKDEINPGF